MEGGTVKLQQAEGGKGICRRAFIRERPGQGKKLLTPEHAGAFGKGCEIKRVLLRAPADQKRRGRFTERGPGRLIILRIDIGKGCTLPKGLHLLQRFADALQKSLIACKGRPADHKNKAVRSGKAFTLQQLYRIFEFAFHKKPLSQSFDLLYNHKQEKSMGGRR